MSLPRPMRTRMVARLRSHRAGLTVLGFTIALTAINAVWLVSDRHGGALGIDESGYVALSVDDYLQLRHGGPVSFPAFVLAQPVQPPLVTMLSAAVHMRAGGPTIMGDFAVQLAAYAVTVLL